MRDILETLPCDAPAIVSDTMRERDKSVTPSTARGPLSRARRAPRMQRCSGCNRTSTAAQLRYHPPGLGPRCDSCQRRSAIWQTCTLGGCEDRYTIPPTQARCEPVQDIDARRRRDAGPSPPGGTYACPACIFGNTCTFAAVLPYHHVGTPKQLQPVHLRMMGEIHLWLMPIRDRCTYYFARVVLWRRFAVLAGIIAGGGDTNCQAAGRAISRMKQNGQWPCTDAKVVLVGHDPNKVRRMTRPNSRALPQLTAQEKGRIHGCPGTLSRQFNIGGLKFEDFQLDPGHERWEAVPLVRKLARLLRDIGMTTEGHPGLNPDLRYGLSSCRWNANTQAEEAFRRSLHTSEATLFAWYP